MFAALRGDLKDYREGRAQRVELSNAGKRDAAYALNKRAVVPAVGDGGEEFARAVRLQGQRRVGRERAIEAAAAFEPQALAAAAGRRAHHRLRDGVLVRPPHPADVGLILEPDRDAARARHHRPAQRARTPSPRRPDDRRDARHAAAVPHANDEIGDVAEAVGSIRDNTDRLRRGLQRMRAQLAGTIGRARRRRRHGRRRLAADGRDAPTRPAAPCRRSPPR